MTNPCQGHAAESAWAEHMKEAERLLAEHEQAAGLCRYADCQTTRSALLAHIQRGAVPEGDDGKRVLREVFALCEDTEAKCSDEPGDFARGRRFEAKGIARAIGAWYQEEFCGRSHMGEPAAPAPDHFRGAAKMAPVHCTPTEHEGRIVYEHTSEPIPNADGFVLYAPVSDQFRDAAKMMAEPVDSMGAPVSCGKPLCSPNDHHVLCRQHEAPAEVPMTQAATDVLAERQRQISAEGWTPEHDDEHGGGAMAAAAGCYALFSDGFPTPGQCPPQWPWEPAWWKPSSYRRDLVKAAALLLAEIERLDRAALRGEVE